MKNKPRYRKSKPNNTRTFDSKEELSSFIDGFMNNQQQSFGALKTIFPEWNATEELNEEQRKIVSELISKCTLFCPHIDTVAAPTVRHFIYPEIKTIFCAHCGPEFMDLIRNESKPNCDYCGKYNVHFVEISVPIGYGIMSFNLGTACCATIMTNEVYED